MPLPTVSNIELLPNSASAHYLAWERNGDLLWLTEDLDVQKSKKLDVYAIQQVYLLNDGLLLLTESLQNNEIIEQLIKLSFSGQQIAFWPRLPDSIASLSIYENEIFFIGFMGDEYQVSENAITTTGKNFGQQASVINLGAKDKVVCHGNNTNKLAHCSRQGSQIWTAEGLWGSPPTLCSNYLLEDAFYQSNNNTENWKYIVRDIATGNILGEIAAPNVSFSRCIENQFVTIGDEINIYSLPSTTPSSTQKCAGSTAQDAVIDNTGMACITNTGSIIKQ
ncbi:hypothetical protein GCM10007876_40780 [Litoribrevibacter albus]|uniref:Uncharacterized protein n=2 Tax=Litoribrevibacter albus TaxID=1473156 RepID=A0AA37W9V8_9GAMM|nr:hypothetical protein GCM10007876_40780 [Litoribrevibacter albus]